MTHKEVIVKAEHWLYNNSYKDNRYYYPFRCNVVFSELVTWCSETPDLLGWARGSTATVLVEVKVSRADFYGDKNKRHRRLPELSMGNYRFFCTPYQLITAGEVPSSYGLLSLSKTGKRIKVLKPAPYQDSNKEEEYKFLLSVVRRVKTVADINGINFRNCFDYKHKYRKGIE